MQAQISLTLIVTGLLLSPAVLVAQTVERATDLQPFDTLELRGCFDAKLAAGTPQRVVVKATAEQHERLSVQQSGNTVTIGPAEAWSGTDVLCRGERVTVQITASFAKDRPVTLRVRGSGDLDADVPAASKLAVEIQGSGDLTLRGSAADCELEISGSGEVVARPLECAVSTDVEVHGSGSVTLQGKTKTCDFDIHGSGNVAAQDFACESADVDVSGSGSIDLASIKSLGAEIHGSGNVRYRGEPTLRAVEVHGSGRLQKL